MFDMFKNIMGGMGGGNESGSAMGSGILGTIMKMVGGMDGIKKMILGHLDNPEIGIIASEKIVDFHEFWAKQYQCDKKQVALMSVIYDVPVKDKDNNVLLDEAGKTRTMCEPWMLVTVDGNAKTKLSVSQMLSLVKQEMQKDEGKTENAGAAADAGTQTPSQPLSIGG